MTGQARPDESRWHAQMRFNATISSLRQLQVFNDRGGIAVDFDVMRSTAPEIAIVGSQTAALSLWETRSANGFVTKPKFNADLVTVRFVASGHVVYRHRLGDAVGSPTHATLVGFDDLREVQASQGFEAVSATISAETLRKAQAALTNGAQDALPAFEPVAEIGTPAMKALYLTVRQIQQRSQAVDVPGDLIAPLLAEILGYQLLSAWPKRSPASMIGTPDVPSRALGIVLEYIAANLASPFTLADIAAAGGISVRSLQNRFRQEIGRSPVQFIIDQRLARAHEDLVSARGAEASVSEIARRWGFAHMGDFSQRYRRLYGRTPSEARRGAARPR